MVTYTDHVELGSPFFLRVKKGLKTSESEILSNRVLEKVCNVGKFDLNFLLVAFVCHLLESVAVMLCNRPWSFPSHCFRQLPIILSFCAD